MVMFGHNTAAPDLLISWMQDGLIMRLLLCEVHRIQFVPRCLVRGHKCYVGWTSAKVGDSIDDHEGSLNQAQQKYSQK
jgi:hypothetical protein